MLQVDKGGEILCSLSEKASHEVTLELGYEKRANTPERETDF